MDKDKQKEIYDQWLLLENSEDNQLIVREVIPGKPLEFQKLDFEKVKELTKYRKWVLRYCEELLDVAQKWDLNSQIDGPINCKCDTKDCAKCLLVNCQDDDCYFHPKNYKEDFRKRYNNR